MTNILQSCRRTLLIPRKKLLICTIMILILADNLTISYPGDLYDFNFGKFADNLTMSKLGHLYDFDPNE